MPKSCAVEPTVDHSGAEEGSALPYRHYAVAPVLGGVELLSAVYRNHRFAPHSQEAAVIGVVEHGRAVVFGAGETLTLEKGSVLVIPPHVLHDSFSLDGTDWHYRALYLNSAQLGHLSPDAELGRGVLGTRPFVLRESVVADQVLATHATLRALPDLGE
ncbi:MAG: AraC family ligand binding domain-containing protein, partial [Gemmatimonadetes bacterium]|nr:AraC family ligand binding domain-containing protein [Gemmatimonadota bacterium]